MRNALLATIPIAWGLLAWGSLASAQELRIGISAPISGPTAPLGAQVRAGAEAALRTMTGATLYLADDRCTAEGGASAARRLVEARVVIVVGFLCTEAAEAALPIFKEARIAVVSPGVRTDSLTDMRKKTGFLFYRLAPRASHEVEAAAALVTQKWRETLFALIDDGTIYGRELAEGIRFAAEQTGIQPAFVDTFRPQLDNQIGLLGRLRKAGATHVFVGGDRDDIAIIARDAAGLDYPLVVAGGESLRAAGAVPLSEGLIMVGLPDAGDGADATVVAAMRGSGVEPEGYVLPTYAALQVAHAAARNDGADGVLTTLAEERFDTVLGPIKFDSKGDLVENPYRVFRYNGVAFEQID